MSKTDATASKSQLLTASTRSLTTDESILNDNRVINEMVSSVVQFYSDDETDSGPAEVCWRIKTAIERFNLRSIVLNQEGLAQIPFRPMFVKDSEWKIFRAAAVHYFVCEDLID